MASFSETLVDPLVETLGGMISTFKADLRDLGRAIVDPRQRVLRQILSKGYTTHREILTASFGTWPPKGLNIDETVLPSKPIEVIRGGQDYNQANAYGYVESQRPSTVRLNAADWARERAVSVIVHEATHTLQIRDDSLSEIAASTRTASLMRPSHRTSMLAYLGEDREVQARLAEILVQGYRSWGKMPATRVELWAAISAFGLPLHEDGRRALDDTPEGQAARATFTTMTGSMAVAQASVEDLETTLEEIDAAGNLARFHEEIGPFLYGHLIENYGDRLGRVRMGLPSVHDAREVLSHATAANIEDSVAAWAALPEDQQTLAAPALWQKIAGGAPATVPIDGPDATPKLSRMLDAMERAVGGPRLGDLLNDLPPGAAFPLFDAFARDSSGGLVRRVMDLGVDVARQGYLTFVVERGVILNLLARNPQATDEVRHEARLHRDALVNSVRNAFDGHPITATSVIKYTDAYGTNMVVGFAKPALGDLQRVVEDLRGPSVTEAATRLYSTLYRLDTPNSLPETPVDARRALEDLRLLVESPLGRPYLIQAPETLRGLSRCGQAAQMSIGAILAHTAMAQALEGRVSTDSLRPLDETIARFGASAANTARSVLSAIAKNDDELGQAARTTLEHLTWPRPAEASTLVPTRERRGGQAPHDASNQPPPPIPMVGTNREYAAAVPAPSALAPSPRVTVASWRSSSQQAAFAQAERRAAASLEEVDPAPANPSWSPSWR